VITVLSIVSIRISEFDCPTNRIDCAGNPGHDLHQTRRSFRRVESVSIRAKALTRSNAVRAQVSRNIGFCPSAAADVPGGGNEFCPGGGHQTARRVALARRVESPDMVRVGLRGLRERAHTRVGSPSAGAPRPTRSRRPADSGSLGQLARPRPGPASFRPVLRAMRSVLTVVRITVAAQLPADRARGSAKLGGDRGYRRPARRRSAIVFRSPAGRNRAESTVGRNV
jgi:hypothetical protein